MRRFLLPALLLVGSLSAWCQSDPCKFADIDYARTQVILAYQLACQPISNPTDEQKIINRSDLARLKTAEKNLIDMAIQQYKAAEQCFPARSDRDYFQNSRFGEATWNNSNVCGALPQAVQDLAQSLGASLPKPIEQLQPWQTSSAVPPAIPQMMGQSSDPKLKRKRQKTLDYPDYVYASQLAAYQKSQTPPATSPNQPTEPQPKPAAAPAPAPKPAQLQAASSNGAVQLAALQTQQNPSPTKPQATPPANNSGGAAAPANEATSNETDQETAINKVFSRVFLPHYRIRPLLMYTTASGASLPSVSNWVADLYLNFPLPFQTPDYHNCLYAGTTSTDEAKASTAPYLHGLNCDAENWRLWGSIRATSAPLTSSSGVLPSANGFTTATQSNIGDALEFLVGVEKRATEWDKLKMSFTASWGGTTPPKSSEASIYTVPASDPSFKTWLDSNYPNNGFTNQTAIAFINPDRNRILQQFYVGLRFDTKLFSYSPADTTGGINMTPHGTFDFMVGMNQAVSGGRWRGLEYRLDGYHPVPFTSDVPLLRAFYLFGGIEGRFGGTRIKPGYVLTPAPQSVNLTDPTTLQISQRPADRDYYRVGVGLDLFAILRSLLQPVATSVAGETQK